MIFASSIFNIQFSLKLIAQKWVGLFEHQVFELRYLCLQTFVFKRKKKMLGLEKKGEVLCRVCGDKVRYFRFLVPGYNLSSIDSSFWWCSNYHVMCSDPGRRVESTTESHRVMAVVDSSNAAFVASPQCEPSSFQFQALISTFSMLAMLTNIWSFFRNLDYVCKEAGRYVN